MNDQNHSKAPRPAATSTTTSNASDIDTDVIVLGAGAAGMMCGLTAGANGRRVIILDHAKRIAEKIRISGGGRCNFTNYFASPDQFLSANGHFCKSALRQYTQQDFIALMQRHNIAFHEKKLGQLFCDHSAQNVIDMLVQECADAGAQIMMETTIDGVEHLPDGAFLVTTSRGRIRAKSLVIATGGLSIPKIGATGIGYDLAAQFGLAVTPRTAALVPLTFDDSILNLCRDLSGLSVDAEVQWGKASFAEGLLFTHRGLSGPSILQISSYWEPDTPITINLAPSVDVTAALLDRKRTHPKQDAATVLTDGLPKRLAQALCDLHSVSGRLADLSDKALTKLGQGVNAWRIIPNGTEGYRTAEVTLGGVDTTSLSSKTMQAKDIPGLYFIGEVVDVTGYLGGYNFQWAWSSGYVAGMNA